MFGRLLTFIVQQAALIRHPLNDAPFETDVFIKVDENGFDRKTVFYGILEMVTLLKLSN